MLPFTQQAGDCSMLPGTTRNRCQVLVTMYHRASPATTQPVWMQQQLTDSKPVLVLLPRGEQHWPFSCMASSVAAGTQLDTQVDTRFCHPGCLPTRTQRSVWQGSHQTSQLCLSQSEPSDALRWCWQAKVLHSDCTALRTPIRNANRETGFASLFKG